MHLKVSDVILLLIILGIFTMYGVALSYNFKTGKPIPEELSYFVRLLMGAAGVAIIKLLNSVGKDDSNSDDRNDPGTSDDS